MYKRQVEGWHTGQEWIDGGTLVHRINLTAEFVADLNHPGIQRIISRLDSKGPVISPEQLVDGCLQYMGHYELAEETRRMLVDQASIGGAIHTGADEFPEKVTKTMQMIVATKEYLYA